MSSQTAKVKLDMEVCESALKFLNLYTETADHRRKQIDVLYAANNPSLIYNGNVINGIAEIRTFWCSVQETLHEIGCLDAHALGPENGKSIIAQVMGNVTLGGTCRAYNQILILVLEDGLYKIQNENYRIIE